MPFVWLGLSVGIAVLQNNLYNMFGKKHIRAMSDSFQFNGISFLFACAVLLCFFLLSGARRFSLFTLGLGALYGVVAAGTFVFLVCAMAVGPLSYTLLISSCSMVIPAVFGALFWRESVHILHVAGLVLLLLSFLLGCKMRTRERVSLRWMCYSLLTFFCNGAVGVLQKLHQTSVHAGENNAFLLVAFLTAATLLLCADAVRRMVRSGSHTGIGADAGADCDAGSGIRPRGGVRLSRSILLQCGVIGCCIALTNVINLYLSGVLPSIFFFPMVNGSTTLLCTLTGLVFFRERLCRTQTVGFCFGFLAVLLFSVAAA